ncbi:MAG: signal peptidase II [Succinivibrio sp.]|nr:signal peptidase II [Succinivibrio sp.]
MSNAKPRSGLVYLILSVLVIVCDQLTKYLVVTHIPYDPLGIEVLPFFNLAHVYNTGAAFSFLAGMGGWQRWFFMGIAVVITLVLLVILYKTPASRRYSCMALALVIGGAIGNLIDRALHGYVVDFLLFYIRTEDFFWAYPTFNVADIGVSVGATLLIIIGLFSKEHKESRA